MREPIELVKDVAVYFGTEAADKDFGALGASRIAAGQDGAARAGEDGLQDDITEFFEEE